VLEEAYGDDPQVVKILTRTLELHPKIIDLSLERILGLLDKLGNPHKKLPPVFHIAGTNGKGSVTALTRAMLEAAGYRVHCYTSPHLVRFCERIRLCGKLIEDDKLITLLKHCEKVNDGAATTFFEFTTAAAFYAFASQPADACIVEVGLGGRLDATNVIEDPLVTAITPIHLDHQNYLGRTLSEIAAEKAGIITADRPVVTAPQPVAVQGILSLEADRVGARLVAHGRDWHVATVGDKNDDILYEDSRGHLSIPPPRLKGLHQIKNAGHAIAILRNQSVFNVSEAAIRAGLDWARWPARLQSLEGSPLLADLPEGSRLWLDGGHNPAAARTLKGFFSDIDTVETPFYLVIGMLAGKDAHRFIKPFQSLATAVYAVPIEGQKKSRAPAELAAEATALGISGKLARNVSSALKAIASVSKASKPPVVLVTGSLYLAGEVLKTCNMIPR
jgi:dihydrofolate synthase / folylpolyglutamate synthase